jgi:hypothetical protein
LSKTSAPFGRPARKRRALVAHRRIASRIRSVDAFERSSPRKRRTRRPAMASGLVPFCTPRSIALRSFFIAAPRPFSSSETFTPGTPFATSAFSTADGPPSCATRTSAAVLSLSTSMTSTMRATVTRMPGFHSS